MTDVVLGFKAFDIHELLCHFVAKEAGLYEQQGLNVKLVDTNFAADQALPELFFSTACGAALAGWLNGTPQKVIFVATDRPLFWLYGRDGLCDKDAPESLQGLSHCRIAGYPEFAPPTHFLNAILAQGGLNPRTVIESIPARDDTARIGLLVAGDVDAAVISSALPPAVMAKYGLKPLLFFGEHLRIPTTGLVIHPSLVERHPDVVGAMVSVYRQSLQLINGDDNLVRKVLGQYFAIPLRGLGTTSDLVRQCFCSDGQSSTAILEEAIKVMQLQLQCDDPPVVNALYDFSYC